ncbi:MAG: SIS domain-containing protein [Anaerolineaceae bacterium]|nr:SIS domain-containing protein [Anaerolineaceae bacterium]
MSLKAEIFEQPAIAERILSTQTSKIQSIVSELREHSFSYVFIAARGTSDNAGRYTKYLWGSMNHLPVALATPSLFSIYEQPPSLKDALVVGISQSGKSPDIVSVLREAKAQGRPTLAITNAPGSPLAQFADWHVDIDAGEEKAVAATKTYTASMMAMSMLSCLMAEDNERFEQLKQVPQWMSMILKSDRDLESIAQRYRYMEQCVVLGRGYNYATAFEWSLKMKELTYVMADPYSSADFQHGPIAMVEQGFPVMAVAPSGAVFDDLLDLMKRLRMQHHVELMSISDNGRALDLAHSPVRMPAGIPEWISPMVAILPAQLFSYYLTLAKGFDTEAPRGLRKVTETI